MSHATWYVAHVTCVFKLFPRPLATDDINLWNARWCTPQSDVVSLSAMAYNMFIGRFFSSYISPNMSLPNAAKDTTEHPPKNAVSAPANKQEKAADVDRKVLPFIPLQLTLLPTLLPLAPILWCHSGFPPRALSFQRPD